ncbi:MAG: hypothetical protein KDC80_23115 [Saprospiraceae bacterium]|nr:hypothetical protein [Saprospiraceae bacterium]
MNRDLESNLAFNLLQPELKGHDVRIYLSQTVGGKNKKVDELNILEYYEKELFYQLPHHLKEVGIQTSFEFLDDDFHLFPLSICEKVNDPKFINEIRSYSPDLFISIRFGKIFDKEILTLPRYGTFNLHSGILPDYRGILGTLHALRQGKKEVGCTLHQIDDDRIDTGKIISVAKLKVNITRSLFWHIVQLYPLGCSMIKKSIKKIEQGKPIHTRAQDLQSGAYYSLPTGQHFEDLKMEGFEILSQVDYLEFLRTFISPDLRIIG